MESGISGSDCSVPEDIKKNIRSVLLSDSKGYTFPRLASTYVKLIGEEIPYQDYGYHHLREFLQDLPDVAKITKNPKDGVLIVYGVASKGELCFVNHTAAKVLQKARQAERMTSHNGDLPRSAKERRILWADQLEPSAAGVFNVGIRRESHHTPENINNEFSEFGEIQSQAQTPKFTFIRFYEKDDALAALESFHKGDKYKLIIPREQNQPKHVIKGDPRKALYKENTDLQVFFSLPPNLTEAEFTDLLDGSSYSKIRFSKPNPMKCFAHVHVSTDAESEALIQSYQGIYVNGRKLIVQKAHGIIQPTSRSEDVQFLNRMSKEGTTGVKKVAKVEGYQAGGDYQGNLKRPGGERPRPRPSEPPPLEDTGSEMEYPGSEASYREQNNARQVQVDENALDAAVRGYVGKRPSGAPFRDNFQGNSEMGRGVRGMAVSRGTRGSRGFTPGRAGYRNQTLQTDFRYSQESAQADYNPNYHENRLIHNYTHEADDLYWLYVANFPYGTSYGELYQVFEAFNFCKLHMKNNNDPNHRAYAFVQFPEYELAVSAFVNLDGTDFLGRPLKINFARNTIAPEEVVRARLKDTRFTIRMTGNRESVRKVQMTEKDEQREFSYKAPGRGGGRDYYSERPQNAEGQYPESVQRGRGGYRGGQTRGNPRGGQQGRGAPRVSYTGRGGNHSYQFNTRRYDTYDQVSDVQDEFVAAEARTNHRYDNVRSPPGGPRHGPGHFTKPQYTYQGENSPRRDTGPYPKNQKPDGNKPNSGPPNYSHGMTGPSRPEPHPQKASHHADKSQEQPGPPTLEEFTEDDDQEPPVAPKPKQGAKQNHQFSFFASNQNPAPADTEEEASDPSSRPVTTSINIDDVPENMVLSALQETVTLLFPGHKLRTSARQFSSNGVVTIIPTYYEEDYDCYFWAQVTENDEEFSKMTCGPLVNDAPGYPPYDGQHEGAVAMFEDEYARCHVLAQKDDDIMVFFVDYGNMEMLKLANVRTAPATIWDVGFRLVPLRVTGGNRPTLMEKITVKLSDAKPEECILEVHNVQ